MERAGLDGTLGVQALDEIERSLHGKLRAHRISGELIQRHGQDALQQALAEYTRELKRGTAIENPDAWIVNAAFRRAVDEVRRDARRPDSVPIELVLDTDAAAAPASEEIAVEHLTAQEVREAIGALRVEERQALRLYFFEERTMEEAAKAGYCSRRTFRRRLRRALESIDARLGVGAPEPGSDLAIEIGLAAWASLSGAQVVPARGMAGRLLAPLEATWESALDIPSRLRDLGVQALDGPAARLGSGGSAERIAALAGGPAAKVIGGCAGAVAVCAIGGAIVTGVVGNPGAGDRQSAHVEAHARAAAHPSSRPTTPAPEAPSRPVTQVATESAATASPERQRPSKAARRRRAHKAEERQVEEQMSAMSRIASEAESEPTSSGASAAAAPESESVAVAPSGGSSASSRASEEAQAEKQFGAFK